MISSLQTKIWILDLKAWTNINLTYSWSEITVNSTWGGWWGIPYISNVASINLIPWSTQDITLNWINFTPNSTIDIPWFDWTINSITAISPSELQANLTTGSNETLYDVIISNWWLLNTLWSGNWVSLLGVMLIIWTGPAGTYTETFEANNLGNWTAVNGLTANVSFQTLTWWTPSAQTWPNSPAAWLYYMYTEATSPNFPNMTFAVETSYFRNAQSISFDYHMFGAAMWELVIQTYYEWVWTDVYTLSGQQQTAQANPWLNSWDIDISSYGVEKIRFFYTSWTDYTWDLSIDNVVITSI